MRDMVASVISVILITIMLFITPTYYIGIIEWARSQSEALTYTRNLIDEVIDTRELNEDTYNDYNLRMAAVDDYYDVKITRKVKCVMPDPVNAGQTYTTYIVVDDIERYNQGDIIIVEVNPISVNTFQAIASALLGMSDMTDGFTLCGRVR